MRWFMVIGFLGCGGESGPTPDKLLEKMRPELEPTVVAFEKIAKAPLPAVAEGDGTWKVPPLKLVMTNGKKVLGNAVVAFQQDFIAWEKVSTNPVAKYVSDGLINNCWMMVRKHQLPAHVDGYPQHVTWSGYEHIALKALPECAALRYVIVIALKGVKGTDYIDAETFGAGGAVADAHVFELPSATHIGAVSFVATSSETATDPTSDLQLNFKNELERALAARIPGTQL